MHAPHGGIAVGVARCTALRRTRRTPAARALRGARSWTWPRCRPCGSRRSARACSRRCDRRSARGRPRRERARAACRRCSRAPAASRAATHLQSQPGWREKGSQTAVKLEEHPSPGVRLSRVGALQLNLLTHPALPGGGWGKHLPAGSVGVGGRGVEGGWLGRGWIEREGSGGEEGGGSGLREGVGGGWWVVGGDTWGEG